MSKLFAVVEDRQNKNTHRQAGRQTLSEKESTEMWFFALTALMFSVLATNRHGRVHLSNAHRHWHLIDIPNRRRKHTSKTSIDHQRAGYLARILTWSGLKRQMVEGTSKCTHTVYPTAWRWLTITGNYCAVVVIKVMMRQKDGYNLQIEWPAMRNRYLLPLPVRSCPRSHHSRISTLPAAFTLCWPRWSTSTESPSMHSPSSHNRQMTISKVSGR